MTGQAYVGQANFGSAMGESERLNFLVKQALNGVVTATLVTVEAVEGQTVDVKPMVSQVDGGGNAFPHGVIHALPFVKLRAGGNVIEMTPEPGDIGLAVFCHNDISAVKSTAAPAAPGSRRRFDWADGVYIGGLFGAAATQFIRLDADGIAIQAKAGTPVTLNGSAIEATGPVDTDTEYRVDGVRVVSTRQSAITPPSGGGTIDAQSRTAIGSILAALQAHGLIG